MGSKLWEKTVKLDHDVEKYTVGHDREMDMYLARYDVLGSIAHITMLETIGLLTADELATLTAELRHIYSEIEARRFEIEDGIEDVHSQVELMLTRRLGDMGKKIHSGRSRNDQVLVDLRLFIRSELEDVVRHITVLFKTLVDQSNRYKDVLMPGYTHLQVAMPSSFGLCCRSLDSVGVWADVGASRNYGNSRLSGFSTTLAAIARERRSRPGSTR